MKRVSNTILLTVVLLVLAVLGSMLYRRMPVDSPVNTPPSEATAFDTLDGIVLKKEWTKSLESWNAGGSEYYVLDTADAVVKQRTAEEGVLLVPSSEIPMEALSQLVGIRVRVTGQFTDGEPVEITEEDQFMQRPVGFETVDDGSAGPAPTRGAGFTVHSIQRIE